MCVFIICHRHVPCVPCLPVVMHDASLILHVLVRYTDTSTYEHYMCSYVLPIPTLHVRKYMYVRKRPLHCQHVGLPTTRRCSLMSSVHDVRSFVRSFVRGRPGELGGIFISSAALAVNPGRACAICTIIETIVSKKHLLHCRHGSHPFFARLM